MKFSLNKITREGVVVDQFFVTRPDSERSVVNLFSAVDQGFDQWASNVPPAMRAISGIEVDKWVANLRDGHNLEVVLCK